MKRRSSFLPLLTVLLLAGTVWLYFTPHLALRRLQHAAEAGDVAALQRMVDFPALRESVKTEVRSSVRERISGRSSVLGTLGGAVVGGLSNPLVDALVTPDAIAAITRGERPSADGEQGASSGRRIGKDLEVEKGYEGVSRFVVRFRHRESGKERLSLVMERDGVTSWKLTGLRFGANGK